MAETLEAATIDYFEEIMGLFGHTYRTKDARTIVILAEPDRSTDLEAQLAEWEQEGAVKSWTHAT